MERPKSGFGFPAELAGTKVATAAAQFSAAFKVKSPLYAPITVLIWVSLAARDAEVFCWAIAKPFPGVTWVDEVAGTLAAAKTNSLEAFVTGVLPVLTD